MKRRSWFICKEKIRFLIRAKNAHGIHSPFVFTFYNAVKKKAKSIKNPNRKLNAFKKKENRLFLAILQYLNTVSALVISPDDSENFRTVFGKETKVIFVKSVEELQDKTQKFDFIYISNIQEITATKRLNLLNSSIHNDTAVIIPHIHASKEAIQNWKMLCDEKAVKLSLDLFFIGILFFRRESTKQHFVLRF